MTARGPDPLPPRRLARLELIRLAGGGLGLGLLSLVGCTADRSIETPAAASSAVPSPSPTPAPTPVPTPDLTLPEGPDDPNPVTVEVLGEPPEDQRVLVEYAAGLARDSFFRQLGFYLDGPVVITVVDLPDLPVHAVTFLREGERISAITVNVGQRTWILETPMERTKVVAHEYFHVLQNWLRGGTDTSDDPLFLVEGSAEYAGYAAVIDAGQLTRDAFPARLVEDIRRQGVRLPALSRLDDDNPLSLTGYGLAALAVDRLVGADGILPLARYTKLRRGLAPRDAFETVFGRTLQSFYLDFAAWRRAVGV